jgi:hypothetical protein
VWRVFNIAFTEPNPTRKHGLPPFVVSYDRETSRYMYEHHWVFASTSIYFIFISNFMPPIFQAPDTNSESESDKESQTGIQGDAESPLSAILGDVPIQNATIGMLAEVLAKVLQTPEIVSRRAARSTREKKKPFIEKFTDLQR